VNKVTFVGFRGGDRSPWIRLCPTLYIISLAWLGFEIALLKGLICNWLEKARICLNACWYQRAPSGFFLGGQQPFTRLWATITVICYLGCHLPVNILLTCGAISRPSGLSDHKRLWMYNRLAV